MAEGHVERVGELTARGAEFKRYDGLEQDERGRQEGSDFAWFKDPAGNFPSVISPD